MPAIDQQLPALVRTVRLVGTSVLSIGATAALVACALPTDPIDPSVADRTYLGLPDEGGEVHPWSDADDRELSFLLGRRAGTDERPCTLDTAPSTSVVVAPGLPADEPVTVVTTGEDVLLPAGR